VIAAAPWLAALQDAAQAPAASPLDTSLDSVSLMPMLRTAIMIIIGAPLIWLAATWSRRWIASRVNLQAGLVTGRLVFYGGLSILVISVLREMGFSLAPLLGAAGILGIALGFASQTSVSNVISGLFLLAERPFVIDDLIEVGGVTGRVLSIDTISVQLRTFDNRMIRIPNETLVKSQVINITRFPIRRVDVQVRVAFKEDAGHVREVLFDIAQKNPTSLMEPRPVVVFEGFGDFSQNFLLGVWTTQANFLKLKNGIQEDIKTRFDDEGIEIPVPHRTLYMRTVDEDAEGSADGGAPEGTSGTSERPAP
jgi:small-conductance mechanosensitive channel